MGSTGVAWGPPLPPQVTEKSKVLIVRRRLCHLVPLPSPASRGHAPHARRPLTSVRSESVPDTQGGLTCSPRIHLGPLTQPRLLQKAPTQAKFVLSPTTANRAQGARSARGKGADDRRPKPPLSTPPPSSTPQNGASHGTLFTNRGSCQTPRSPEPEQGTGLQQ